MRTFADNAPRAVGGLLLLGALLSLLGAVLLPPHSQPVAHAADGGGGEGQGQGQQHRPAREPLAAYGYTSDYDQLADAEPVAGAE